MMKTAFCLLYCLLLPHLATASESYVERSEVREFMAAMANHHGFAPAALEQLFNQIAPRKQIIEAISRPAEAKPWHRYRPIFLTERRIREGVAFMQQHAAILDRAEAVYGVPAEVISAILGVETFYGRNRGRYRVLESLATLAFDYPPRSKFFRGELEQFLLLTREEGVPPLSALGSYAGAMGQPQFIASSFRHYAVDFNGDGRRDIWDDTTDVIGSVANYLGRHGWQRQAPIASPALVTGEDYQRFVTRKKVRKPAVSVATLGRHGVRPATPLTKESKATLLALERADGEEYWLTLDNFYVITRYNHSPLYAMAVYQLSREITRLSTAELAAHGP